MVAPRLATLALVLVAAAAAPLSDVNVADPRRRVPWASAANLLDTPARKIAKSVLVVDPAMQSGLPDALRHLRTSNGSLTAIWLRGGTHRLPGTGLALTAEDRGTATTPTIIGAFPGEQPRLSAGYDVSPFAWSAVPASDPIYKLLPPATRAAVRVAQLPANVSAGSFAPELSAPSPYLLWEANRLELFAGHTPMHVARWPNLVSGVQGPGGAVIAGGARASWTRTAQNSGGITVGLEAGAPAAGWAASMAATTVPIYLKGFFGFDFSDEVVRVVAVAPVRSVTFSFSWD
eukprot:SAG31_NODE_757_length_12296_cov_8.840289_11_plen_290_part_00